MTLTAADYVPKTTTVAIPESLALAVSLLAKSNKACKSGPTNMSSVCREAISTYLNDTGVKEPIHFVANTDASVNITITMPTFEYRKAEAHVTLNKMQHKHPDNISELCHVALSYCLDSSVT